MSRSKESKELERLLWAKVRVENDVIVPYDKKPKYIDNSRIGSKKRRKESILRKLKPIKDHFEQIKNEYAADIDVLLSELEDLEERFNDVEYAFEHIDSVYESILEDKKVSREDLKHCEDLYSGSWLD
tara:strand:+ start:202 stop:585 length:384 start_codon:yes stop_codon:yes gene_type:complete